MRIILAAAASAALMTVTTNALAQATDACAAVLRQGLFNHFSSSTALGRSQQAKSAICDSYSRYQQDKLSARVAASYGVGSGEASFSKEQMESVGKGQGLVQEATSGVVVGVKTVVAPAGAGETRPKNVSVQYLIKY